MNRKSDRPAFTRGGLTWVERLVLVGLCLALCVLIIPPAAAAVYHRGEARAALRNGKAVRLAAMVVSIEQRSAGAPFADQSEPYGFAAGVEEKILLLSKAPGEVWLLQTDEDGYGVSRLIYREYEYTVDYIADPIDWEVSRQKRLIASAIK